MSDKEIQPEIQVYKKLVWCLKDMPKQKIESYVVGQSIASKPTVINIGGTVTTWNLVLYPGGRSEESKDSIGPFMQLTKGTSGSYDFKVKFSIGIVGKKLREIESAEQAGGSFQTDFGINLLKRDDLCVRCDNEHEHGYLVDGKLTLYCNITLFANEIPDSEKKTSLNQNLQGDFKNMMSDTVFVDFKVETADDHVLQVHKNVLAFRSPYFFGMLTKDMKEAQDNLVKVPEDAVVMKEVIRFIYCNEVENLNAIAYELVLAAEKYLLDDLKELCIDSIIKSLKTENVLQAVLIADDLSKSEKLKVKCFERISSNFALLENSEEWDKIRRSLLLEIIRHVTMEDKNTIDV